MTDDVVYACGVIALWELVKVVVRAVSMFRTHRQSGFLRPL